MIALGFEVIALLLVKFSLCEEVQEKPVLVSFPSKNVISENAALRLFCFTSAGTKPLFFQWQKNGQTLSNSPQNNYQIETSNDDESQSVLRIRNVVRSDAGNYSCIASNAYGTDTQHSMLVVKVAIKWTLEPKDMRVNLSDDSYVECNADGEPKPNVYWITSKGVKIESTKLRVRNYMTSKREKITCVADNGSEDALRKEIVVLVNAKCGAL